MNNDTNKTIITLFLQALYKQIETEAFLNICLKDIQRNGILTKTFPVRDVDQITNYILSQREHTDVYLEVCLQAEPPAPGKRGKADGVKIVPGFWLDIDIDGPNHKTTNYPKSLDEALQFIYSLPWSASVVVCSGGGIHVYYLFSTPVIIESQSDKENIAALSRGVNRYVIVEGQKYGWKIDNTSDLARLLRVPATLNHKSSPAKDVFIIEYDLTALYTVEDFQVVIEEEIAPVEILEPETSTSLPVKSSGDLTVADDFPEADIELIESHCKFMAHCLFDAKALSEPEWFIACSIWVRCINGNTIAHERSKPYPGYDPAETDRKLNNALDGAPRTCASILSDPNANQYCNDCFLKGKGKSPISLGNQNPIAQANLKMAKLIAASPNNPKLVFEDDNLAALALLKFKSPGDFITVINALKKAGVAKGEIRPILDRFIASNDMSFEDVSHYEIISNSMYMNKATAHGMTPVELSAFSAKIVEEIIKDDGAEAVRYYRIEGIAKNGTSLPSVTLPVHEFETMSWIGPMWGTQGKFVGAGGTRDHLRAAITYLSEDPPVKYIYGNTGWSNASGEWAFLSAAGAIGKDGILDSLTVDLSTSNLSDFSIPEPTEGTSTALAIKKALVILALLPKHISYPLLSAVFRAPLGESLPINFALFIVGATGSFKSEIASIVQGFYGANFLSTNLPSNWASTENAIEKGSYQGKDVLFVIDDFVPGDNPRRMNSKADRVFRALGNRAGRQRMNADTSLRKEYYPRSLIVSTAEDVPSGQSLTGRMLVLEIDKDEIDTDILTELQRLSAKGTLNAVLFYYLRWLAPQITPLKDKLPNYKTELRMKAVETEKTHSRTPDIIADLAIGFEYFCSFAVSHDAMTVEESANLKTECWNNLLKAAAKQQSQQQDGDPCKRFRDLLNAAFLLGLAHLESTSGGVPTPAPAKWGWKSFQGQMDETGTTNSSYYSPQGSQIGWTDHNYVYLESESAFNIAQRVGSRDRPITTSLKTLRLRLAERKYLVPDPTTGGNTIRMTGMGSNRPRVMQIHKSFFDEEDNTKIAFDSSQNTGVGFHPKELKQSQVPTLVNDAMFQPTLEENLFETFNNIFGKK